jgi:hypothetical protein
MRPGLRFIGALIITMVAFAPLAVANAIVARDSAEFLVGRGELPGHYDAQTAMDSNGNFVVVWRNASGAQNIVARRFHDDGTPAGVQFVVNTAEAYNHTTPSVAMTAGGDFVIAWQSAGQSGDSSTEHNIYARRFSADGTPSDPTDMVVNTQVAGHQHAPSVAIDAGGNYVVAWQSDAAPAGIYARRFAANGIARDAAEWKVNTRADAVATPHVAMDEDGDFAMTWKTGDNLQIRMRRFAADRAARDADDIAVETTTTLVIDHDIAMDTSGNVVVAWNVYPYIVERRAFFRRYAADGTPRDAAGILVNGEERVTCDYLISSDIDVAMSAQGDFVVMWEGCAGDGKAIYARRYAADGTARDTMEFGVSHATTRFDRLFPALALDADGDFVSILYTSGNDSIYGRRFAADGTRRDTNDILINETQPGPLQEAHVAVAPNGDFAIVWSESPNHYTEQQMIRVRRYLANGTPRDQAALLASSSTSVYRGHPSIAIGSDSGLIVTWAEGFIHEPDLYMRRFDAAGVALGQPALVNTTAIAGAQITLSIASDADGDFVVAWRSGGDIYARRFNAAGAPQGDEFPVADNAYYLGTPQVAAADNGDFVIAWALFTGHTADSGIYARRFAADGTARDPEGFRVNPAIGQHSLPSIASDADGDFVVAWQSVGRDGDLPYYEANIYARRYAADGTPKDNGDVLVNTITTDNQLTPSVAMDGDGDFVVAWQNEVDDEYAIHAQSFLRSGVRDGSAFAVNTHGRFPTAPAVGLGRSSGSDLIATWSLNDDGSLYARRFAAPGVISVTQPSELRLIEGGEPATLTVALRHIPSAAVEITFTPSSQLLDLGAGPGAPYSLTLPASAQALEPHQVQIRAAHDMVAEALRDAHITMAVTSDDIAYGDNMATILLNDVAATQISVSIEEPSVEDPNVTVFLPLIVR